MISLFIAVAKSHVRWVVCEGGVRHRILIDLKNYSVKRCDMFN